MLTAGEPDLVEFKESFGGQAPDSVRRAICAFANDLPNHGRASVIFVGADDRGVPTDLEINDALLLNLAHCKTDGNIVPPPTMTVARHKLSGGDVAVLTVWPSDSPPVRYRGRIWTRTGPRKTLATAQDEWVLSEKRRHHDAPFDAHAVKGAELADLDLLRFQYLYLPLAFEKDVLARNDRTIEERLSAMKMIASADDPTRTVVGVLTLCLRPMQFIAGAYVQFLRFDGLDQAAGSSNCRRQAFRRTNRGDHARDRRDDPRSHPNLSRHSIRKHRGAPSNLRFGGPEGTGSQRCYASSVRRFERSRSDLVVP